MSDQQEKVLVATDSEEVSLRSVFKGRPETQNNPSTETKNTEVSTVPYDRFKEVNDKAKALEAQLAQFTEAETKRKADAEAAEKKRLEEQQKFEELYKAADADKTALTEKVTQMQAQVKAYTNALTAQWESEKGLIPDMYQGLVEALPLEQRIQWLSDNKEKLAKKTTGGGTPTRRTQTQVTEPERRNGFVRPSIKF